MGNKNSPYGTLFLIPTSLDQDAGQEFLIHEQKRQLAHLSHFIVENEKPARKMLKKLGLEKSLQELILFPNTQKTDQLAIKAMLAPIFNGESMGLLSDSGTPCIADPGNKIVAYAHLHHICIKPLVGPSSIILSLMSSGFNGQNFRFIGYLPKDKTERNERLVSMQKAIRNTKETQIFIETPYRNNDLLADLVKTLESDIMLSLSIDLTTPSEQIISQSIDAWRKRVLPDINKKLCIFLLN
ncbi:SAM-dependent methyltransferase [Methylophilaceae bacterium]|jgi:16S rRNA (cytidine1402-2'-O)-methyltransferase|nr:MAG: hypothetical protein ABS06_00250 [Methylophilales bacterium BACL14 MAG-120910-bin43]KRP08140.1 MAG: hypothetical protein ABS29_00840 [Methylophilales bacterium BACL14 MAG-120920-bin58]MDA7700724.1 SAM-dependent methyltransferase [Methylophilaceae bacterium]